MENKVLLVTLQGDNIGNRLQNYALQESIKKICDCKVFTPYYYPVEMETFHSRVKYFIKCLLGNIGIKRYKLFQIRAKRLKKYKDFNEKYIDNMFRIDYTNAIKNGVGDYNYAITGSDQVWHGWSLNSDEIRYFYLEFMPKDKRISYAPSFGFSKFPEKYINIHKEGLQGIAHLSCREKNGIKLIEELTGRKADFVLDPTLLLNKNEWLVIEKKPEWINDNKPYVLNYFLGNKDKYATDISEFARKNNFVLVEAYDINSSRSQLIAPDEFIWLINHAEYICTDSFHATVFSLIFEKKFLSFRRNESGMECMFDRIENIQNIYGVDRIFNGKMDAIKEMYNKKDITKFKEDSLNFLKESLGEL